MFVFFFVVGGAVVVVVVDDDNNKNNFLPWSHRGQIKPLRIARSSIYADRRIEEDYSNWKASDLRHGSKESQNVIFMRKRRKKRADSRRTRG